MQGSNGWTRRPRTASAAVRSPGASAAAGRCEVPAVPVERAAGDVSSHHAQAPSGGVDVAIPCYQYGRYLRGCVTSVLSQGIEDVRVLVIDNASSDDSVEIAQQLATEDRRVEVVAHRRNLGPHASFNEGIEWASSRYFMVLCADDLLAPGALGRAVSVMDRTPGVGFAYGRALWLRPHEPMPDLASDTHGAPWRIVAGGDLLERFCRTAYDHVIGPVVVRTVAQKLAGYYRPELPHTDDFEMWMRLACLGPAAETTACQGILRLHESNRPGLARQVAARDLPQHERQQRLAHWHDEAAFESFFEHEGGRLPDSARLHRLARRSLAARAYWAAVGRLCRGQTGTSRDLWQFAINRRPLTAILPPLGYLLRRDDAVSRIIAAAFEPAMVRSSRAAAEPTQADG